MGKHRLTKLAIAVMLLTPAALAQRTLATIELSDADDKKSVEAAVGQRIEIRLPANVTTGYEWLLQSFPGCLELSDFRYGMVGKQMPGAGGFQTVNFIAKSSGVADVRLEYRRPWEHNAVPTKTFTLKVTVR